MVFSFMKVQVNTGKMGLQIVLGSLPAGILE